MNIPLKLNLTAPKLCKINHMQKNAYVLETIQLLTVDMNGFPAIGCVYLIK